MHKDNIDKGIWKMQFKFNDCLAVLLFKLLISMTSSRLEINALP